MSKKPAANCTNLVSIICRTIGRRELTHTLESIARQSYANIELILVNSVQTSINQFDLNQFNAVVVNPENALNRAQAANAGLDAANGKYLMFLDDDDWIANNHVTNLVSVIDSDSNILAAYSSTVKTRKDGTETDEVFNRDFDPFLLMLDNYIPIHAVLFEKNLLEKGCRFDESFDIYEDWDFWLQVSQHTTFVHSDKRTAFYRAGGDSDTAVEKEVLRFQSDHALGKARAALFSKWKESWDGNAINQMLCSAMQPDLSEEVQEVSQRLQEVAQRLDEELIKTDSLNSQVISLNKNLKDKETAIEERDEKLHRTKLDFTAKENFLKEEIDGLRQKQNTLKQEIDSLILSFNHKLKVEKNLNLHIHQLEAELNRVFNSPSWRIMGPIRRISRIFTEDQKAKVLEPNDIGIQEDIIIAHERKSYGEDALYVTGKNSKEKYDNIAKSNLNSFLKGRERLEFKQPDVPALSILLVFFNKAHLSLLCLQALLEKGDLPFELVIVDNASSDDTSKILERIDNAVILCNDKNFGFVEAINQAADHAKGDFLLLLNNDAVIHEQTLSSALSSIANDNSVGAVGGKIILTDGTLQEAGSIIWQDGSCLGYGRGDDPDSGSYMFERDVDYCSGAFLLFRRSDFDELDGFNIDYAPAYYEESDFCVRLQKKGLRIAYNPQAKITHYEFASSDGLISASELQKKHQQIFCQKHGDWLSDKHINQPLTIQLARTSNKFPNVLVIDDRVPHPSLGSGYPRAANLVNSINELELNVSFYPLQFPVDSWPETYITLSKSIEVILNEGREGLFSFLESRRNFFQYIVVSRIHNMAFVKEMIEANPSLADNTKIIYDAEALTAPREIMQMQLLHKFVPEEEQKEMIEKEMQQAAIADTVIAVSKKEADSYSNYGIENVAVLGHMIKTSPSETDFSKREGLLFVGALRDEGSPNVDSLLWFIINVLPYIESSIPGVNLYVVGDLAAPSLASIEKSNVSFMGRIDKLDDIYASCRIFVAPTRFAAGIPRKVHEAAAMGLPCVTTPLLAEQLDWQSEKEILTGLDPKEFADQCIRLYQDAKLWSSIREAGLTSVTKDCSVENFQRSLISLFN